MGDGPLPICVDAPVVGGGVKFGAVCPTLQLQCRLLLLLLLLTVVMVLRYGQWRQAYLSAR